jgi:hypothetical protein
MDKKRLEENATADTEMKSQEQKFPSLMGLLFTPPSQ